MHKDHKLPKNHSGLNWTQIRLKCGLKCWFSSAGTIPISNTGSWRSDLLLKCY